MSNENAQNERNAVQILALAGEGYIGGLDELSKNFVTPQVRAALQIFAQIVAERNPQDAPVAVEAEGAPAPKVGKKVKAGPTAVAANN